MLSRRGFILSATTAAGLSLIFCQRLSALDFIKSQAFESEEKVLKVVQETIGEEFTKEQIADFFSFYNKEFEYSFHESTPKEVFARKVCTEFVVNSNLPYNNFDLNDYKFVNNKVCNPFFLASSKASHSGA